MPAGAPLALYYSEGGRRCQARKRNARKTVITNRTPSDIAIRLMKNTEQDIIQKLDSVPNKAGYIKQLIRADMAKDK